MYFSIEPLGNFGNRMLEYMAALAMGRLFPEPVSYNCQLPEIGLEFDGNLHDQLIADEARTYVVKDSDFTTKSEVAARIKQSGATAVVFRGFFQRYQLYEKAEFYRDLVFKKRPLDISPFDENDLVINIRAGEILGGGVSWYPLVPVNFYKNLISRTKCNPVFVGQIQDCEYVREIQKAFPGARMIPSGGAITDFNRLLHAKRICITVSTFSWLAAWLSNAAEIHYPLLGFLHPFCLPKGTSGNGGIDLTPLGDPRYRYHLFPILNAEPDAEYLRFTKTLNPISQAISEQFVDELCRKARTNYQTISAAKNKRYLKRYPDAAWSISSGRADSALAHYENIGKVHGYSLFEIPSRPLLKKTSRCTKTRPKAQSPPGPSARHPKRMRRTLSMVPLTACTHFIPLSKTSPGGGLTWAEPSQSRKSGFSTAWNTKNWPGEPTGSRSISATARIGAGKYSATSRTHRLAGMFKPEEPIHGRFVRIRLLTRNCLHLEQVEVYGEQENDHAKFHPGNCSRV
jgi:hypothetical protein